MSPRNPVGRARGAIRNWLDREAPTEPAANSALLSNRGDCYRLLQATRQSARPVDTIIAHHSAGAQTQSAESVAELHKAKFGSDYMGYHWYVRRAPDGWRLYLGRPASLVGAHDKGQNAGSIGVCFAGTLDTEPPDSEYWGHIVWTCAALLDILELPTTALQGHNEHETADSATRCPGIDPGELRRRVRLHRSHDA